MSEQLPSGPREDHPILAGLGALVGVAVVVGLILGLVLLAGVRVLGLGGGSDTGSTSGEASAYIPRPSKTPIETAPQVTLAPGPDSESEAASTSASSSASQSTSTSPRKPISLSASTTTAAPMEQFELTGTYPDGEGAILTVQRFQDGSWQEFPATGSVAGGTFSLPVQTSQAGLNRFRVVDSDTGAKSNEVHITIG